MNSVVTHVHVDNVTLRLSLHHTGFSDMVILLCNSILLLQEKWPFQTRLTCAFALKMSGAQNSLPLYHFGGSPLGTGGLFELLLQNM